MSKKVSIIIPCYNDGKYLPDAIDSVKKCRHDLIEIIIVNDGSTDFETLTLLKQYELEGVKVLHQQNKGLGAARNAGILNATCDYILPLDSDNKIRPEYIDASIAILDQSAFISVVYGRPQFFGDSDKQPLIGKFNLQRIMVENYIDACAVFRKSDWKELGGYDENMPFMGAEDWEFWLRFGFAGKQFHFIDEVLFDYRVRSESMLRTTTSPRIFQIKEYMCAKHPYYLDFEATEANFISKGRKNTIAFLLKLFVRIKSPAFYSFLLGKGLFRS